MEQSPREHFSNAVDHAQEYLENQVEIIRLETAKHGSKLGAYLTAVIFACFFFSVFYLMANVALAFCINSRVQNLLWSFLIVAAGNLLLGLIIILFKRAVIRPVQNILIRLITD
jgi:hypothetical protein